MVLLSFAPASAQQAISTPILQSDENFRDLAGISAGNGGTGFVDTTSNNGVMRTGVFYRSEALSALTSADSGTLFSKLRIGLDIDLRTPSEIQGPANPPSSPNAGADIYPDGVYYTKVNIYGTPSTPSTLTSTPPVTDGTTAGTYMTTTYQNFVTDPVQRAAFHTVLIDLANEADPALYHCSGGKDRTGWTSMLLQSIAGVSPTTIMQDYMASNNYMAASIYQILHPTIPLTQNTYDIYAVMLGVQRGFLQAGLDQVIASYGSLNAYLIQGLGLTQADIYVLRAKMVYYSTLPGQSGFAGNAASGAALLNALQNSPLSGHYTSYNYYLQSAIDMGTLGGVETQVGGQVHADAASYLLRQPLWVDGAITPYTSGRDLGIGQTRIWLAGLGGYFGSDGRTGFASSTERSAGSVMGGTYRIGDRTSAYLGLGNILGSVGSAGASADVNTALATIGGRYGFSTLEAGPYVAARANVGWVDYQSKRALGGGLGTTQGNTKGAVYGGGADVGDVIRLAPFIITPQLGVRVTQVTLGSFNESGSELALGVNRIKQTSSNVLADLDVSLDPQKLDDWTIAPSVAVGYEQALGNPQVESTGTLYGFNVSQYSAYDSQYLMKVGLAVTAQHGAFTVKAGVNAIRAADASSGINAQLFIGYKF
jgi:protein tyrosine/serine phosphatase